MHAFKSRYKKDIKIARKLKNDNTSTEVQPQTNTIDIKM